MTAYQDQYCRKHGQWYAEFLDACPICVGETMKGGVVKKTESNIETFFRQTVKEMGGKSYKWTSPGNNGVPDRINFFPGGLVILAEIKAPGKTPTPLQWKVIGILRDLGTEVVVIDSIESVRVFKEIVGEAIDET